MFDDISFVQEHVINTAVYMQHEQIYAHKACIYLYGDNNSSLNQWLRHLNHIPSCVAVFEVAYAQEALGRRRESARHSTHVVTHKAT